MNPQYVQQKRPLYGPPPSSASFSELNANFTPKGSHDLHSFPPSKPPVGPLPTNNTPAPTRPPYYINDIQSHGSDVAQPPVSLQYNQNKLVDQMSSVSLARKSPPPQGFPLQAEKPVPTMPFSSGINGISNQNNYSEQGEMITKNLSVEKSTQAYTTQTSSLPPSYGVSSGLPLSGQHQHSGHAPPLSSPTGINATQNISQPNLPTPSDHRHGSTQLTYNPSLTSQANLAGVPKPGKHPGTIVSPNADATQHQGPSVNQTSLGQSPMRNQQNMTGPSTGIFSSDPSIPNRQIASGAQLIGQGYQNLQSSNLQNLSRTSVPGLATNMSGPPLPGQQNLSSPWTNASKPPPLPVQQTLHTQYHASNQTYDQRQFSPTLSHGGHQSAINSYGHMNHHHADAGYHQGYQQQNYGQIGSNNFYENQSPYQTGMTSPSENHQPNTQPQQTRKLDPDQMPSPIQVIQDDRKTRGGVFTTNQKGLVPPLVTTKFTVEDQGNASPRFIRSSMYTVPAVTDLIKQTQIPLALILSPMAQVEEGEYDPPIVDMGEIGPVRCNRCKAYMSPFMQFIDAGRRFQCMFCKATTEVPSEYFQHLDHTGQRMDRYSRPELMLGTYEFIATKEYCRNNTFPNPPAIIFAIDVSYNTIKSGLVHLLCTQMKNIIRKLPVDVGQTKSNMKVGFITYSNTIQFYNIKASLAQPQMMIVGDVQDVFMPLLDGFLCDPEESETLIDSLMSQIPTMFAENKETETILAPAIQAGLEALKASECAGKVMVFHSSLPTAEAPGKLKNRDDRKLLGTNKEKNVIAPQTNFYNNLGQDCVGSGCSVDLFIFNNSYIDIATIGQVSRLTGGEVYKYTYFQADTDGERLITDIMNNLSRPVAFDAVMRVRTSTGIRPTDFFGHFYMYNTTDMELASIDCDKAIAIELKHDDKLSEEEGVYIQTALLYTSCSGVRRLRVINLSLKTSSQMPELFRSCDLDAIINFLSKQSVFKLLDSSSQAVKESLNARCAAILAAYRKHCALPSSAGQLILPECMKLLPLYINGLFKSDGISGGSGITVDQKSYVMMALATMPISESVVHVYPRLLPLHDIDPHDTDLPPMLRCSIDKFTDEGAYLLENGIHMFLWLGLNLNMQWVQSVFGVQSVNQIDTDRTAIPILDNALNIRIRNVISCVQSERRYCMRLTLTRQRDKMEMVMRQFLVEDQRADGCQSYVDFLCCMHKEIRILLR